MLSVVIAARDAAYSIGKCLDAVCAQAPEGSELIVVDDGSRDATAAMARSRGAHVIRVAPPRGIAAARNTGAAAATGDVVAFVDVDDGLPPGWAAVNRAAMDRGAQAARTAGGSGVTVRRTVFGEVGGYDEALLACEDLDLALRLAIAGYPVVDVNDVPAVDGPLNRYSTMVRARSKRGYWRTMLGIKWHHYPFVAASLSATSPSLTALADDAIAAVAGAPENTRAALRSAVGSAAERTGAVRAWIDVLRRRAPVSPLRRSGMAAAAAGPPLPTPAGVVVGDPGAVRVLVRAVAADSGVAAPPPGPAAMAAGVWDSPAPWARRVVRQARRAGWRLPEDLAARRIETERPSTWGEAILALYGTAAWLGGKHSYLIAAPGRAGALLAARFSERPLVLAGENAHLRRPADLALTESDLRYDPEETAARLAELIGLGAPRAVAVRLKHAALKRPRRWS